MIIIGLEYSSTLAIVPDGRRIPGVYHHMTKKFTNYHLVHYVIWRAGALQVQLHQSYETKSITKITIEFSQ